jgi:hypothetical protein
MTKFTRTLLFLTLILGACSPGISSSETLTPNDSSLTPIPQINTATTPESSNPKIILTVGTPNIGQPPDGNFPTPSTSQQECGYQWAYNNLPELTEQFDRAIKNLNPESTSHATAFGENCVASDGQVLRFLAMETDFYVILSVTDLNDYEAFGNWIAQVMQVVNSLPPDMLAGPNPGFVEFRFEKSISESIGLRVPIRQYNETVSGKTGEELFRMFYTTP